MTVFDAQRVVAFPSLSLASGAVKGWDRCNAYTFSMLESVARHCGFDIDTPFEALPEKARQVLLHGSGDEAIAFVYEAQGGSGARSRARSVKRSHPFEGILPTWSGATARPIRPRCARTWRDTRRPSPAPTAAVRGCGARHAMSSCSKVRPSRRRAVPESTHRPRGADTACRVPGRANDPGEPIYRVEHKTLAECLGYFEGLQLQGAKAEIADKIVREIRSRLKFLNDVGLNYLSLDRSADTLSGGEAQRIRLASQIGSGLTGVMYVLDEPSIGLHQREVGQEGHELVAAEPGDDVRLAHLGGEPGGGLDEELVADRVPERVVDVLEAVEVDEQDRDVPPARPVQRRLDATGELAAVRQPGEPVLGRLGAEHVRLTAHLGDEAAVLDGEQDLARDERPEQREDDRRQQRVGRPAERPGDGGGGDGEAGHEVRRPQARAGGDAHRPRAERAPGDPRGDGDEDAGEGPGGDVRALGDRGPGALADEGAVEVAVRERDADEREQHTACAGSSGQARE